MGWMIGIGHVLIYNVTNAFGCVILCFLMITLSRIIVPGCDLVFWNRRFGAYLLECPFEEIRRIDSEISDILTRLLASESANC